MRNTYSPINSNLIISVCLVLHRKSQGDSLSGYFSLMIDCLFLKPIIPINLIYSFFSFISFGIRWLDNRSIANSSNYCPCGNDNPMFYGTLYYLIGPSTYVYHDISPRGVNLLVFLWLLDLV